MELHQLWAMNLGYTDFMHYANEELGLSCLSSKWENWDIRNLISPTHHSMAESMPEENELLNAAISTLEKHNLSALFLKMLANCNIALDAKEFLPNAFQVFQPQSELPFIYVPLRNEVFSLGALLHEFGHGYHALHSYRLGTGLFQKPIH